MVLRTACLSVVLFTILSGSASASSYSNPPLETPFDITLDTGSNSWSGSSPILQSTDTSITVNHTDSSSIDSIVTETTPAQVGVPGTIDVYQVTNTTSSTHDHTYNDQNAQISFDDSLTDLQTTPQGYILSGTINKQAAAALYNNNGYLNFNMGMGVSFPNNPGGIDGSLTFEFGSNPEAWAFSYTTEFSGLADSIFLSNSEFMDLTTPIYFNATYSVTGVNGTPFNVDSISLSVNAHSGDDFAFNFTDEVTEETNRILLAHADIPPLQPSPVPIPAATWLFGSGLLGLIGVARRKTA